MANITSLKRNRTRAYNVFVKEVNTDPNACLAAEEYIFVCDVERADAYLIHISTRLRKLTDLRDTLAATTDALTTALTGDEAATEVFETARDLEIEFQDKASDIISRLTQLEIALEKRKKAISDQHEAATRATERAAALAQEMADLRLHNQNQARIANLPGIGGAAAAAAVPLVGAAAANPVQADRFQHVTRLPKLEIAKFSGDILKFREFWDSYEPVIHTNTGLTDAQRFAHLKSKLENEPLKMISGLEVTNDNYKVAVKILNDRYGNKTVITDQHISALSNLSSASNNVTKLRQLYDDLELHFQCLEAMGQNVNDSVVFASIIKSKMPKEVLHQLTLQLEEEEEWTVRKLRANFGRYLRTLETVSSTYAQKDTVASGQNSVSPTSNQVSQNQGARSYNYQSNQNTGRYNFRPRPQGGNNRGGTAVALYANDRGRPPLKPTIPCIFCNDNVWHWPDECTKYPNLVTRKKQIKGRCFNCLRSGHLINNCQVNRPCFYCKKVKNHHRSLCPEKFDISSASGTKKDQGSSEIVNLNVETSTETGLLAGDQKVFMQTALVEVQNEQGTVASKERTVFDSGSTHTYVAKRLSRKLRLKERKGVQVTVSTFATDTPKTIYCPLATLVLKRLNGSTVPITVRVLPKISGTMTRGPIEGNLPLCEYTLADTLPQCTETNEIEFLIGADYYTDFILSDRVQLTPTLCLLRSAFGWVIAGRAETTELSSQENGLLCITEGVPKLSPELSFLATPDTSLPVTHYTEDFWKLENIGVTECPIVSDDNIAFQKFTNTVKVVDNRYEVAWPYKEENPNLPENKELAYGRFKSLCKRLFSDQTLLEKCDTIIKEQEKLGIIEKVMPHSEVGLLKHYVPHHAVITPLKATTKYRMVFDASAKSKKENKSLNECLYRGPVLLQNLCGLLLRFRLHFIALVADIEKAFLNVGLRISDRDVTRFFWFRDINLHTLDNNLQVYRFARIPFGVISSPFLLAAVVNHLLDRAGTDIAQQVKHDIYVDNLITGTADVETALHLYNESRSLFSTVSLNLREWASNSNDFLAQIPAKQRATIDDGTVLKVLGLKWDTKTDLLCVTGFDYDKFKCASTKRTVLQAIASIYDPLGYFTPVTLPAKIFLHSLWSKSMEWDTVLTASLQDKWREIAFDLNFISTYGIPRFITEGTAPNSTFRLVCFCDASATSYASCIYLLVTTTGITTAHLVFSKTRLSPKDKVSIPRLELLAALIGSVGLDFVASELLLPIEAKYLFSDSQCVLHWLYSKKTLSVFVGNQVRKIQKYDDILFRFVSTNSNPADFATCGKTVTELADSIWWNGPSWLLLDPSLWPNWDFAPIDQVTSNNIEAEERASKVFCALVSFGREGPPPDTFMEVLNYSKLPRFLHVIAWCLRFIRALKVKSAVKRTAVNVDYSKLALTAQEISCAKRFWELRVQTRWFPEVLHALKNDRKHNLIDQLGLQLDAYGVLRCYGRLSNAQLIESAKKPKLMPTKDYYTALIINDVHFRNKHSGVAQTLAMVRQEYWIPRGRSMVRSLRLKCLICEHAKAEPYPLPKMPPWPASRITESAPFTYTGLDYFGPLYVKDKPELPTRKVWVCLFTCLNVRAVHLELIDDMTAAEFVMCFRRFVSTHGKPDYLLSDNAPQFKLATTTFDGIWATVIHDPETSSYVSDHGIQWKFITEHAPWMGGVYERMVGLVKTPLKKAIGKVTLTSMQLRTLLSEVQAVVNCRPLVYIGDDIDSTDAFLSPAHFLSLNPKIGIPENRPDEDDFDPTFHISTIPSGERLFSLWKKGQVHLNRFWKVWQNHYLLNLRERMQSHVANKKSKSPLYPKIGDVVLIKEALPRGCWKLARIHSLYTSEDGKIRSAKVQLPTKKFLNRPINLLCPLECAAEEKSSDLAPNRRTDDELIAHQTPIVPENAPNIPNSNGAISTNENAVSVKGNLASGSGHSPPVRSAKLLAQKRIADLLRRAEIDADS